MLVALLIIMLYWQAHAQDRLFYLSIAFHAAGSSLDGASSYGRYEQNGFLRSPDGRFEGRAIAIKAGLFGAFLPLELWSIRRHRQARRIWTILSFAIGGVYTGAAIHNWRVH